MADFSDPYGGNPQSGTLGELSPDHDDAPRLDGYGELTSSPRVSVLVSIRDDLQNPGTVRMLFDDLENRVVRSPEDLTRLIYDFDELLAALSSTSIDLLYKTFQDTSDTDALRNYQTQLRTVSPLSKERADRIRSKVLDSPFRGELDEDAFGFYLKHLEADRRYYDSSNADLHVRASELVSAHNSLEGNWKAVLSDRTELTRAGVEALLTDPNRTTREIAWRAAATANDALSTEYHQIFDQLLTTRAAIAASFGEPDFTHYHYKAAERPYSPEDSARLHEVIEGVVVPALAQVRRTQASSLGLNALRPWDVEVYDRSSSPPRSGLDSLQGPAKVFKLLESIDPSFGELLRTMEDNGDLDLVARPHKRSGGYLFTRLLDSRLRLMMNAAGGHSDVRVLSHEAGHALHGFKMQGLTLASYRGLDGMSEMAETASFATELFATQHYRAIYDEGDAKWARRRELVRPLETLCWVAKVDSFEQWANANPTHSHAERESKWAELETRFNPGIDWHGCEEERGQLWTYKSHPFLQPLYYITYGYAQIGALQLFDQYRSDPVRTFCRFEKGLSLGFSRPLPELWDAIGVQYEFGKQLVSQLVNGLLQDLAELDA